MRDMPNILALINTYAAKGIMLPRTQFEMSENIRDFSVAYQSILGTRTDKLIHSPTINSSNVRQ